MEIDENSKEFLTLLRIMPHEKVKELIKFFMLKLKEDEKNTVH